jgi:hypothetical protein
MITLHARLSMSEWQLFVGKYSELAAGLRFGGNVLHSAVIILHNVGRSRPFVHRPGGAPIFFAGSVDLEPAQSILQWQAQSEESS